MIEKLLKERVKNLAQSVDLGQDLSSNPPGPSFPCPYTVTGKDTWPSRSQTTWRSILKKSETQYWQTSEICTTFELRRSLCCPASIYAQCLSHNGTYRDIDCLVQALTSRCASQNSLCYWNKEVRVDVCSISSKHRTFLNLKGRQFQRKVSIPPQSSHSKLLWRFSEENITML